MATLNQIKVDSTTYDVEDAYARRRIEGASSVYSIVVTNPSPASTFINIITGENISGGTLVNTSFATTTEDITLAPAGVLLLNNGLDPKVSGVSYGILVSQLALGDTIYVVEKTYPDRWVSAATSASANHTLTAIETKSSFAIGSPDKDYTSSAGGETVNTSSAGGGTASGTATVTYKKSDTATGSAGAGESASTGTAGGGDVTGTAAVSYTKADGTTNSTGAHTHSVSTHAHAADVTVITGINAATASGTTSALTGVKTAGSASLTGTTVFNTDAIKAADLDWKTVSTTNYQKVVVEAAPSLGGTTTFVTGYPNFSGGGASGTTQALIGIATAGSASMTGTTVFNTGAYKAAVNGTILELTAASTAAASVTYTAPTFNSATVVTGVSAASLGAASTGAVSISAGNTYKWVKTSTTAASTASVGISHSDPAFNSATVVTGVSGGTAKSTASVAGASSATTLSTGSAGSHSHTVGTTTATASGTATVTLTAHSHSYTKPVAHTHSIGLTDTTITGTAAVSVSAHTHSVTTSNHTHSLSNHTHSIVVSAQ